MAFLLPFHGVLIGSEVAVAAAVGAGGSQRSDVGYRRLLSGAGPLLVGLAMSLLRSGVTTMLG